MIYSDNLLASNLPQEIYTLIFNYIPRKKLGELRLISKDFHELITPLYQNRLNVRITDNTKDVQTNNYGKLIKYKINSHNFFASKINLTHITCNEDWDIFNKKIKILVSQFSLSQINADIYTKFINNNTNSAIEFVLENMFFHNLTENTHEFIDILISKNIAPKYIQYLQFFIKLMSSAQIENFNWKKLNTIFYFPTDFTLEKGFIKPISHNFLDKIINNNFQEIKAIDSFVQSLTIEQIEKIKLQHLKIIDTRRIKLITDNNKLKAFMENLSKANPMIENITIGYERFKYKNFKTTGQIDFFYRTKSTNQPRTKFSFKLTKNAQINFII